MSIDDIDRPAATADGDTKNMSRIQLRTHGLLGKRWKLDENQATMRATNICELHVSRYIF